MGRQRLAKNRAFPANLYQNSKGYFYYRNPQTKKQKGLGREKAFAFQEARKANAALATREPSSLVDWVLGRKDYTLIEWLPVYRELWEAKTNPAANTRYGANSLLKKLAESELAKMRMRNIETMHVSTYLESFEKTTGAGHARNMRSKLRDIFRWAETQGVIDVAKNPVPATFNAPYKVKRERLSLEQFWLIHAKATTWAKNAMMLALVTGQRRDDIANMKFADYKDGLLHVAQGKSGGQTRLQIDGSIKLAKVGMSIGDVIAGCRDLIISRYLVHHTERVSSIKPGDKVRANGLSDAFKQARELAKIEASDGRTPPSFHEIRSLSERLYREEFGPDFAQSILGHKSVQMTDKYDDLRGGWKTVKAK
ncbi:tyrosine-type recombinase/integrase [Massilia sp. CT11-137]|uniref:tyrosine-type recombinase/integrase n=1 Tax=Massilia sp. CT11-137 TaxID=3393901 RepID=UPI0039AFC8FB